MIVQLLLPFIFAHKVRFEAWKPFLSIIHVYVEVVSQLMFGEQVCD